LESRISFYVGNVGSGAEVRARAAVDIALWDLAGRITDRTLAQLIGTTMRDDVRAYNTCAGPFYMRRTTGQRSSNWGIGAGSGRDDLWSFLHEADALAEDLLASGIGAMKIWPLDLLAESTRGRPPEPEELKRALEPLRRIRAAVGERIEIMIEMHALWTLEGATAVLPHLEEFGLRWVEDPVRMHRADDLERLRAVTSIPLAGGETVGGLDSAEMLIQRVLVDVLITHIGCNGGVGDTLALADATRQAGIGFSLHDCSGPVVLASSAQLAVTQPHVDLQETTRAYYGTWYPELVSTLPRLEHGRIRPADGPGHGLSLRDDLDRSFTVTRELAGAPAL
jgi:L-alanine-DL-glutamate epimerase-like enolase superfamily enzyme